jgi:hypothetical protein
MTTLTNALSDIKSRDEFHAVTETWCWDYHFRYDMSLPLRKNISAARRQNRFIVAIALSEAARIYDKL